ncbi:hypothetical protein THAOC_27462, partial [Thalassiosira oceanica]
PTFAPLKPPLWVVRLARAPREVDCRIWAIASSPGTTVPPSSRSLEEVEPVTPGGGTSSPAVASGAVRPREWAESRVPPSDHRCLSLGPNGPNLRRSGPPVGSSPPGRRQADVPLAPRGQDAQRRSSPLRHIDGKELSRDPRSPTPNPAPSPAGPRPAHPHSPRPPPPIDDPRSCRSPPPATDRGVRGRRESVAWRVPPSTSDPPPRRGRDRTPPPTTWTTDRVSSPPASKSSASFSADATFGYPGSWGPCPQAHEPGGGATPAAGAGRARSRPTSRRRHGRGADEFRTRAAGGLHLPALLPADSVARGKELQLELWTEAALLGDLDAHFQLGRMYFCGEGVEKDEARGIRHWQHAAIQGHPESRCLLGYFEDKSGNHELAVQHLLISAKMGLQKSLNEIKGMFMKGHASKAHYAEALNGYQNALEETKSPQREEAKKFNGSD